MTPLVSVVIPTRNRSSRVVEALASAQAQTEQDIEIVVVDDASTDNTAAVLAARAADDRRVRVLRQPEPGGGSAARNRGLDESHGEFVAFLDDDDRWLSRKLERQVAYLRAHTDVVVVSCHHRILEGDAPALEFRGPIDFSASDLLWVNVLGTASNAVLAPHRLAEPARFDAAFPAYQDWDFYVRCNRHGPVAVVPEVLCEYVVHDDPDRLTNQLAKRLAGHELFVERHGAAMTSACLSYHEARMRVLATTSRREKLCLAPQLLRDTQGVALRALATESFYGRLGRLRRDPARPMRHLQQLARRQAPAPN